MWEESPPASLGKGDGQLGGAGHEEAHCQDQTEIGDDLMGRSEQADDKRGDGQARVGPGPGSDWWSMTELSR